MTINQPLLSYQGKRKESLKYVLYLKRLRITNNDDYIQERNNHLFKYKKSKIETLKLKVKGLCDECLNFLK